MLIKLEDGNVKDVAITEVTAENYIVPEKERDLWHCVIEIKQFDPKTGRRISRPRVQKFNDKIWQTLMRNQLRLQGYDVLVVYDPTAYIAERQKERAELRKAGAVTPQQAAINAAVKAALAKAAQDQQAAIDAAVEKALAADRAKRSKRKTKSSNENKG